MATAANTAVRGTPLGPARTPAEPLDFAIFREVHGEGRAGSEFDPRRSPEKIARRLRVSPATVRRRIGRWRTDGFLLGYDVLPHPELLGSRMAARVLEFTDPRAQRRALGAIRLIDGMVQIDPARSNLLAVYYTDTPGPSQRRRRQLEALEEVTEVGPELTFDLPACAYRMSRTDWRLLAALRRAPEARRSVIATELGLSTRTVARRLDAILDAGAVMFDPIFEFSRFCQTIAVLVASVEQPARRPEILHRIRALHPSSVPTQGPTRTDPSAEAPPVQLWVTAPTTAELDQLGARVAHLPGVRNVMLWYESSTLPIREWLDEQIDRLAR